MRSCAEVMATMPNTIMQAVKKCFMDSKSFCVHKDNNKCAESESARFILISDEHFLRGAPPITCTNGAKKRGAELPFFITPSVSRLDYSHDVPKLAKNANKSGVPT